MSTVTRSNPTATVIDTRPGEVRVRLNDNAELPRWYPSLLQSTSIGAVGTMLRLNQEGMHFIPRGISLPSGGGGSAAWGGITGTLSDQGDLYAALNGKASATHDHAGVYSPASHTHTGTYEPAFAAGTTAQYLRGDKTWQTLNKAAVGLANVDNTSDLAKPISTATQTALNGKATSAQGALADTAVQPAAIANFETTTQLNARDTANRARANHTGNQAISTVTNLQEILDGKPIVIDDGNRATAIGVDATASGAGSFAAGDTAVASGMDSVAIGTDAAATANFASALGRSAVAGGSSSVAVGRGATATGSSSVAVGNGAYTPGNRATALGANAEASGLYTAALGGSSKADSDKAIAVGDNAMSLAQEAVAVGYGTRARASGSTAIGTYSHIDVGETGIAEIRGKSLRVLRRSEFYFQESEPTTLQLADATGTLHTIGATPGALTYDGGALATQSGLTALVAALIAQLTPKAPGRNTQNLSLTRTTAGDIDFTTSTATVTGLTPSTSYNIRADMYLWMSTASTGSFRPVVKVPTGGGEFIAPITNAVSGIHDHSYGVTSTRTSNASGEISIESCARWNSGSITSSRTEIILTVIGPA